MSTQPQPTYSSEAEWKPAATTYGSSVGRTSAHAASRLVSLAGSLGALGASSRVLDVGAGAGAVSLHILATTQAHVTASDLHQSMLDSIAAPTDSKLSRQVADARRLPEVFGGEAGFSHVFCTFVLQTLTTPVQVLEGMRTLLRRPGAEGGVVGIACWAERNDPFEIWEAACRTIDPSYRLPVPFDDPHAWRTEDEVAGGLREAGFKDVRTEALTCPFPFEGTEAYLDFWFGGKNPAALRVMSNWEGSMADARRAVAKVCREQYDDGRAVCTNAVLGIGRV